MKPIIFSLYPLLPSALAQSTQIAYRPCPLLGPRFPLPVNLTSSKTLQAALANLTVALNGIFTVSNGSEFTETTPNTTSFSLALFSREKSLNISQPFLYEYHHTAPLLASSSGRGVKSVNALTVFNAADVTTVFTVYALLVAVGYDHWFDRVMRWIPELSHRNVDDDLAGINWQEVRLVDLASNLASIPPSAILDTLSDLSLPSALRANLPPKQGSPAQDASQTQQQFLTNLSKLRPVIKTAATPIKSDAAFQLLALASEKITGRSFADLVTGEVFQKLGMADSHVGTPSSTDNAIIPQNETASGWAQGSLNDSFLLAAKYMYTSLADLSRAGQGILNSTLLHSVGTHRWLKPISQSSNPADDVGAPWTIYRDTLDGTRIGTLVPVYTQFGTHGLYSSYFGRVPDWGLGFAILSADTHAPADLNAHVDLIATYVLPALEKTAIQQAATLYSGNYITNNITLTIKVDALSGLSLSSWVNGKADIRAAYADIYNIPAATLDFRLYPTELTSHGASGDRQGFRAVLQDIAAPIDGATPTCISWRAGVGAKVYNAAALDKFDFVTGPGGMTIAIEIPVLNMTLRKM